MPQHYGHGAKGAPKAKPDMDRAKYGSQYGEKVVLKTDIPLPTDEELKDETGRGPGGQEPAYSGDGMVGVADPLGEGGKTILERGYDENGDTIDKTAQTKIEGPYVPSQLDPTPPRDAQEKALASDHDALRAAVLFLIDHLMSDPPKPLGVDEVNMLAGILNHDGFELSSKPSSLSSEGFLS